MTLDQLKILNVWAALGGGELRNRRGRAFWRDGDGYSVTLDEVKNAWYDFRDGMGGGVLSLVETVGGYSRGEALTWLERNCGLDPRRALSPQEKRLYAAQAAGTERLAERLTDFARGLELIAEKTVIDLHGFLGDGYAPEALAPFHRQLFILKTAHPRDVAHLWRNARTMAGEVERVGREHREESERITMTIIELLMVESADVVAA